MSLLFLRLGRRPLDRGKSAPRIDLCTAATWKRQVYLFLLIRRSIWRVPYDLIGEPFAAMSDELGVFSSSGSVGGTRLT